jgi:site-specific recombinase XerD
MKNATAQIYLRTDFQRKDGTYPIYLRITIDRKTKKIPLGITVNLEHWDAKNLKVKRGDVQHLKKNMATEKELARAKDIVFNHKIEGKTITFDSFESQFKENNSSSKYSFFDFANSEIENDYRNRGSYDTYRTRKSTIKAVKDFFNKDFSFDFLTYKTIKELDDQLKRQGKSLSTRARVLKTIKTMFNRAIQHGYCKHNPVEGYKYSTKDTERERLNKDELQSLENLFDSPSTHYTIKRTLQPFLFCCYTGLRYKDIQGLRFSNVIEDIYEGQPYKFIRFTMHKSNEQMDVPLNKIALALLPEKGFREDKIFKVYSNQPLNRYLKEATKLAGINKTISFHCSRHTFATLLLSAGVPIETVSKLLGHKDIKTTQIYAKVLPKSKINAVKALNSLMNSEN